MENATLIPPALTTVSSEYFTLSEMMYKTSNGITENIEVLPVNFYNLLLTDLNNDPQAKRGLDRLNIKGEANRVNKHYDCNYSMFDGSSDVSACGSSLGPKEYGPCPKRETCKAHGLLCKIPGGLTVRQVQIAIRIALGQSDYQICLELFISQDTLRSHKNNIEEKIGAKGKVAIGVWAVKNKLI
ncbi:response regulator transcription factor [Pedobacter ginsengisoli]|uniref:response regulator transcription factor n=1 Tax=Pedobacter ginsengisoli TaxID=363852 RepID=UPI002549D0BE|nr:helix-turn-helix transcriptional regulator [Pedobacter ginsengisoli]